MYDMIKDRFPSAEALHRGALICCADVPELKQVGLGTCDLHVELGIEETEEDGDVYVDPFIEVKLRRRPFEGEPGEWQLLGRTDEGFSLLAVPLGRPELLKWISDLEDELLEAALEIEDQQDA